jgi:predicted nuclease with TOPRIM domain
MLMLASTHRRLLAEDRNASLAEISEIKADNKRIQDFNAKLREDLKELRNNFNRLQMRNQYLEDERIEKNALIKYSESEPIKRGPVPTSKKKLIGSQRPRKMKAKIIRNGI